MSLVAGQLLYGGRYVIETQLAQGGFGITYLAKDRKGNSVVIKTLKDEVLTDPDLTQFRDKFQRDFRNEALRLALCRHPHIVQVENSFHEGQFPCIAMEYIEGEELRWRVKNRGSLSESEALLYIQQIGEALAVMHDKGLLHRDVKPHNIIIRSGKPEAVLIDFGIAREFIPDLTQAHTLAVSNGFAPIEQYAEQARRGEYTDVYALAATLYYLLTQKVPTAAPARAAKMPLEPPQQLNPTISNTVNQAILKGMAFEPEERPQSVQKWLELLKLEGINTIEPLLQERQAIPLSLEPHRSINQLSEQPESTTICLEPSESRPSVPVRRILWVDDNPVKNARQVAALQDRGVQVIQALSTAQAMQILTSENLPFDAVISNRRRREEGEYRTEAGVSLSHAIRAVGIDLPICLYFSGRPVELFNWLSEYISSLPS